jgi:predicted restriction endonuclease
VDNDRATSLRFADMLEPRPILVSDRTTVSRTETEAASGDPTPAASAILPRRQGAARHAAAAAYPFRCCVICGLQIGTCLTIAHLDHNPGNNASENLAYMCQTHHWMYDAGLYPVEAITLIRAHWQQTGGVPSHKARMKDAGAKAVRTRKRSASARRAWGSRRSRQEQETPTGV